MSRDKNASDDGKKASPNKELRTLVGVPSLDAAPGVAKPNVPAPVPSTTQVHDVPPATATGEEANTAVDVKAISADEAKRVLEKTGFTQEEIPTSKPSEKSEKKGTPLPGSFPTKVAPPAITTIDPRATARGVAPPPILKPRTSPQPLTVTGTLKGAPPPPPARVSSKPPPPPRRATLVDSGEAPKNGPSFSSQRPPIRVPTSGAQPPKSVTLPPPWMDGPQHVAGTIPASSKVPDPSDSVEEISASILLGDDEDLIATRKGDDKVEEISGSILLPDESAPPKNAPKRKSAPPPPLPSRASAPPAPPTVKGHAGLAPPIAAKTQESPAHAPMPAPSPKPPEVKTVTAPLGMPVPLPAPTPKPPVVAPPTTTLPIPQTAQDFPPMPPPVSVMADTSPMPAAPEPAPMNTPEPAPEPAAAPEPLPAPAPAPAVAKTLESPQHPIVEDPSLPAGVPVPTPEQPIIHPDWPPKIEAAATSSASQPQPQSQPASSAPPPHTTLAPDPSVDGSEALQRFLPVASLLRTRPKWLVPAAIGGGAIVLLGLIGLVCGGSKAKDETTAAQPSATATISRALARLPIPSATVDTTAAPSATTAPAAAAIAPEPPKPASQAPSNAACTMDGSTHTVAPRAVVAAGVEALALDGKIALGFATSEHDGLAVALDPSSLGATKTAKAKSADVIRRLAPLLDAKGALVAATQTDRKGDKIKGRRTVVGDPSFDVGFSAADVVAAPRGSSALAKLWPLEGDGTPDAVRGVALDGADEKPYAVAFRRGNAIYAGVASAAKDKPTALAPKGALLRFDGIGDKVGSPAVAASGDTVMVAWADHASDGTWKLRTVRFRVGEASPAPSTFPVPPGGLGQNAIAPGIFGVSGGRFVLVWTEGSGSSYQVRAQTIGANGEPVAAPMAVSPEGVFAGEGRVAVLADGHGVVAYLGAEQATGGKKFELRATSIRCAP